MEDEKAPGNSGTVIRILIACAILGAVYALLVFWISPGRYRSTIVLEVQPDPRLDEDTDEHFLEGEIAFMHSKETLEVLADSMELPREWELPIEYVATSLQYTVNIEPTEDGKYVKASVIQTSPRDARKIAQAVPVAYAWRREKLRKQLLQGRQAEVESKIIEEEDVQAEAQRRLNALGESMGMPLEEGTKLTRESFLEYFEVLPRSKQAEWAERWADFESHWAVFEKAGEMIDRLDLMLEELQMPRTHDSVVIIEEANLPDSVILDGLWLNVLTGVGKGLLLAGLILVIRSLLIGKARDDIEAVKEPRRVREAEPGDVW